MKQTTLKTIMLVIALFTQYATAQNFTVKWNVISKERGTGEIYCECSKNEHNAMPLPDPNCKHSGRYVLPSKDVKDGKMYIFTSIHDSFSGCKLSSVVIPNGINTIRRSFFRCGKLMSVTLPNSIAKLWGSFNDLPSLSSITIPNSVTEMESCFNGCKKLSSITIPNGLTKLDVCFNECDNLKSISIP